MESCHQEIQSSLVPLRATCAECQELGGREQQTLLQLFSKSLALQAVVSMLHLEHIRYFIILVILKGTQFGSTAWSGGVRALVRGSALHGGMLHLCWLWDFFKSHVLSPASCLSSAQRSQLKAFLGLAWFRVVYGQSKWNCPCGHPQRATCCQISHSVMLSHGHCLIYFLDSPFCLIKRKKKILYLKQNQPVLSPPTPHSIMIKIAT